VPLVPGPAGIGVVQAVFRVNSSLQSVRIGSFGPSRIINTNLAGATLWIGNESVVRDGLGIPIAGGTSAPWTGQGDLWAILGTDASSVGQTIQVVVTSLVDDWQPNPIALAIAILNSGILLVDNPVTLFNQQNPNTNGGTATVDVSTFQSLYVIASVVNPQSGNLFLNWFDSAGTGIGQDVYRFAAGDLNTEETSIPVKGSRLQVTWSVSAINSLNIQVIGSHRPWSALSRPLSDRRLIDQTNLAIPAGGSTTFTPSARYDGPAMVYVKAVGGGAAAGLLVAVNNVQQGTAYESVVGGSLINGVNHAAGRVNFTFPRDTWTITVTQLAAVAEDITCTVVASPEGT
jgi:hypothetical protein